MQRGDLEFLGLAMPAWVLICALILGALWSHRERNRFAQSLR